MAVARTKVIGSSQLCSMLCGERLYTCIQYTCPYARIYNMHILIYTYIFRCAYIYIYIYIYVNSHMYTYIYICTVLFQNAKGTDNKNRVCNVNSKFVDHVLEKRPSNIFRRTLHLLIYEELYLKTRSLNLALALQTHFLDQYLSHFGNTLYICTHVCTHIYTLYKEINTHMNTYMHIYRYILIIY